MMKIISGQLFNYNCRILCVSHQDFNIVKILIVLKDLTVYNIQMKSTFFSSDCFPLEL